MRLTDIVLTEHGVINVLFAETERLICATESVELLRGYASLLKRVLLTHAQLEDTVLLPVIRNLAESRAGFLHDEHKEIKGAFAALEKLDDYETFSDRLWKIIATAREHFKREEWSITKLGQELDEEQLVKHGKRWAALRPTLLPI